MDVIVTKSLGMSYGKRVGIRGLDLSVPKGALYGFLGPNGSGKTTAIRVLLGLLRPTEGSATVLGMDSWRDSHRIKAEVGTIPGDLRLYPWMTARNALRIFGQARKRDITPRGMELAEIFALDPLVPVRKMSRGMRQKLGLILALAHEPALLVLDEPTISLDPPMQQALYDLLSASAKNGATVFFSSHTLSEVETLCHRVAILRDGELVADESLDTLRERAKRIVTLRWKDEGSIPAGAPSSLLTVEAREGLDWRCALEGRATAFLQWAASQPLEDLTIGPPDLDRLFRQYYQADNADS